MTTFKVGDTVERVEGGGNIGEISVVTSLGVKATKNGPIDILGFNDKDAFYYAENYVLVERGAKTDEELAADYRAAIEAARVARIELVNRGFILKLNGTKVGPASTSPMSDYVFEKTVTTTV